MNWLKNQASHYLGALWGSRAWTRFMKYLFSFFLSWQLAQEGLVNQSDAKLLHELGERATVLLHSYFRSPSGLFMSFSHLVCRSAVAGNTDIIHMSPYREILITVLNTWNDNYGASQRSVGFCAVNLNCSSDFLCSSGDQEGRLDLSHPVHVDNCLLEPETKQCWREPPAFIHRDLR